MIRSSFLLELADFLPYIIRPQGSFFCGHFGSGVVAICAALCGIVLVNAKGSF